MTTLELIGERWESMDLSGTAGGGRRGLPGLRIDATLHFGPFAGWGSPTVIRADSWWRPLSYVVRDEDIVRAHGNVEWSPEGIGEGQSFLIRVPPPPPRPWMQPAVARLIASPLVVG